MKCLQMDNSTIHPHHVPAEFCRSRAAYRQGRKLTAVKVYTVSKESSHLLIFNVPAINLTHELRVLCERFGKLVKFEVLEKGLELEDFTDVFHVNYQKVPSARYAKKHLDSRSFYGGFLHVCYAPERETVEETRIKLITRRNEISMRTNNRRIRKSFMNISRRPNATQVKRKHFEPFIAEQCKKQMAVTYNESSTESSFQPGSLAKPVSSTLIPSSVLKKSLEKRECSKSIPRIVFHTKKSDMT